jgi:hypothetical protein
MSVAHLLNGAGLTGLIAQLDPYYKSAPAGLDGCAKPHAL